MFPTRHEWLGTFLRLKLCFNKKSLVGPAIKKLSDTIGLILFYHYIKADD